ncbi:MAG: GIY-YIG nuclease family protein [Lachnospiraceae bacterium]|nr:GIY-YIG nuclease family protein [Lachnospiraceae bacterium]
MCENNEVSRNAANEVVGVIYIVKNPAFAPYIKIGYTSDITRRMEQLNRSECIPFAFQLHATYGVTKPLQDKEVHRLIDSLNPNLRVTDEVHGRIRRREFFEMSPEDAYKILESIAKISGTEDRLQKYVQNADEIRDEAAAETIQQEAIERRAPFSFEKCGIPAGAEIHLLNHPDVVASVKDDRHIEYHGETYSLSGLAMKLLDTDRPLQGPIYWKYQGKILRDIRSELEEQGLYR